jgi:hypothetical protein
MDLEADDALGLEAFGALLDLELHGLAFVEALVAVSLNG